MRLKGLGVSAGVGVGTAVVLHRVDRRPRLRRAGRAASRERSSGCRRRGIAAREQIHAHQGTDRQQRRRRARLPLRRPAADARRPDADRPRDRDHPWRPASTRRPRCSGHSRRSRRSSTAATIPTCANGAATSPTSSGGCAATCVPARMPLDLFRELEGPLVLVADELTPSLIAQLDWHRLAALVSDEGSWTYHTRDPRPVDPDSGGGRRCATPAR